MDWAVDFLSSVDKEDVRIIRDTLEAKLKAESGQYGEAARILWEILVQVRHAKKRDWECITMVHMGKVYRALRWRIAEQLFEDALELAETMQLDRAKVMCLAELGEMKCHWGQFDEALDLFTRALDLVDAEEMESKRLLMLDMVVAYEGLDDLERCREILDEVIVIDKKIGCEDVKEDMAHLDRITQAIMAG
jgi:tetratricopeptide (TPR) repeat protein